MFEAHLKHIWSNLSDMEAFVAHLQLFEAISSFEALAYFKLAALLLKVSFACLVGYHVFVEAFALHLQLFGHKYFPVASEAYLKHTWNIMYVLLKHV